MGPVRCLTKYFTREVQVQAALQTKTKEIYEGIGRQLAWLMDTARQQAAMKEEIV